MYLPQTTFVGAIMPVSGIADYALHTFIGISWNILLPYTVLGVALMIYSHARLVRGQQMLRSTHGKISIK